MFKKFEAVVAFVLIEIVLIGLAIYCVTPLRDVPDWWYPLAQTVTGIVFLALYFFFGDTYVVEPECEGVKTFSKKVTDDTLENDTYYALYPYGMKIIRISPNGLKVVMEYTINDSILMKFTLDLVYWAYDTPTFARLDADDTLKTLGSALASAMKAAIANKELYRAEFSKEKKTQDNNVMRQLITLTTDIKKRLSATGNPFGSTDSGADEGVITFFDLGLKIKHLSLDADFANEQTQKDMYQRTKEKLQSDQLQEQNRILLETVAGLVDLGVDKELATLAAAASTGVPTFVTAKTYLLGDQLPKGLMSLGDGAGTALIAQKPAVEKKGGEKK